MTSARTYRSIGRRRAVGARWARLATEGSTLETVALTTLITFNLYGSIHNSANKHDIKTNSIGAITTEGKQPHRLALRIGKALIWMKICIIFLYRSKIVLEVIVNNELQNIQKLVSASFADEFLCNLAIVQQLISNNFNHMSLLNIKTAYRKSYRGMLCIFLWIKQTVKIMLSSCF